MAKRIATPVITVSIDNLAALLNAYEVMLVLLAESAECSTAFRLSLNEQIEHRRGSPSEAPNLFVLRRLAKRLRGGSARLDRHPADSIDSNVELIALALALTNG